jgi:hypothetical protein
MLLIQGSLPFLSCILILSLITFPTPFFHASALHLLPVIQTPPHFEAPSDSSTVSEPSLLLPRDDPRREEYWIQADDIPPVERCMAIQVCKDILSLFPFPI